MFLSETVESNGTKLWWNGFLISSMATMARIRLSLTLDPMKILTSLSASVTPLIHFQSNFLEFALDFRCYRDRLKLTVRCEFLLRDEGLTVTLRRRTAINALFLCWEFSWPYEIFVSWIFTPYPPFSFLLTYMFLFEKFVQFWRMPSYMATMVGFSLSFELLTTYNYYNSI